MNISETTSTIDEDITSMHTTNTPHNESERSPWKVQSQDLVHANSSGVPELKIPFCVAFTQTAITFAYELGLHCSLAPSKSTQNGIFSSGTPLELTCKRSCDWTLQGERFRFVMRSVGCVHGSDVIINGTRRFGNVHTGTEGFQMNAEMRWSWSMRFSDVTFR